MTTKGIQIRVDPKLKAQVEKIFETIGIDTPTAVRMFFKKVAATGSIPFTLQSEEHDRYTPKQLAALDELAAQARKGRDTSRSFSSVDDLLEDLHS